VTSTGPGGAGAPPAASGPGVCARPHAAVLGTGIMGLPMARNLLRGGLAVDVWDRSRQRAARLSDAGATAHRNPAAAVTFADIVITMLPDAAAVRSVVFRQGMLDALRPGAIWAQMGTIGIQGTEALAAIVSVQRGDVLFVDAPVSGTRGLAESGELLILASGPDKAQSRLAPAFNAIGSRTIWLGQVGAGSRLKLALNTWLAFLIEGTAESTALADSLGVDQRALIEAVDGGPLGAGIALAMLRKIDTGEQSVDLSLRWALKDINLALSAAGSATLPVAEAISGVWRHLVIEGLGDLDVSAARQRLGHPRVLRDPRDLSGGGAEVLAGRSGHSWPRQHGGPGGAASAAAVAPGRVRPG
jgi:3-hydroxyisobutyrate dehydrogenase